MGITYDDVEKFRKHKRFDMAYLECQRIRRDFLIDRALDRRFDPSFVKFLLSAEIEDSGKDGDNEFIFSLEVKD